MSTAEQTYNGWKNYETWNVALWIGNDEGLYWLAKKAGYYSRFLIAIKDLAEIGLISTQTPDGVDWNVSGLDIKALDEMIGDL